MLKVILTIAMLLCTGLVAQAEIYKWKDKNGNTHYSDKPVINSEQMEIKQDDVSTNKNISKAAREERRRRLLETYDIERKQKKEQQEKQYKQKARKNAQCGQAKDRLRRYKRASSLYNVDKDGNRITLPEGSLEKSINKLQKQIKKHCK